MAEEEKKVRKPRIRKTAPTVRERAEQAQVKASKQKPRRLSKITSKVPRPKVKIPRPHLPDNRFFAVLRKIFRPVGKVLSKLAPRYFVNAWRELRLVAWPNRSETWRLTVAVFIFSIVFGALVAGVDKGLDVLFKHLVLK